MNPVLPNEFSMPEDVLNAGLKCCRCNSRHVVYRISVPGPNFVTGTYCYPCLLNACRAASRIPYPIEVNLLDRLRVDLGLDKVKQWYFFS